MKDILLVLDLIQRGLVWAVVMLMLNIASWARE
jgi:hypothetical protein